MVSVLGVFLTLESASLSIRQGIQQISQRWKMPGDHCVLCSQSRWHRRRMELKILPQTSPSHIHQCVFGLLEVKSLISIILHGVVQRTTLLVICDVLGATSWICSLWRKSCTPPCRGDLQNALMPKHFRHIQGSLTVLQRYWPKPLLTVH